MAGELDSRLTVLERHAISTEKRLDGVDAKLDQIVTAVTRAESKPQFNPAAIISFVKDAAILVGLASAAIVYVTSAHVGTDLVLLNFKVGQLSRQADANSGWKAGVEPRE
jgi:hypothetical protein